MAYIVTMVSGKQKKMGKMLDTLEVIKESYV